MNWLEFKASPCKSYPKLLVLNHFFSTKIRKNPLTRSNLIPNLILNEKEFKTNEEKGKCFGELLSSIFSPNSDLIDTEKDFEILNSNSDFFRNNNQYKIRVENFLSCYFRTTITLLNQWPNQKVINKLLCDQEINVEFFNC
ncbi:hypothetical protein BpHYR1_041618 [Brachionus plicatilis]|uniref:Uncharacterized protein n=1 Tax=Brachionus plicatilis TaxID=10195 RepID=A0A3M7RGW6_BRAPC|nr:hypothetical protein BpHYR1_041618 [Brachionus plicatilis]